MIYVILFALVAINGPEKNNVGIFQTEKMCVEALEAGKIITTAPTIYKCESVVAYIKKEQK